MIREQYHFHCNVRSNTWITEDLFVRLCDTLNESNDFIRLSWTFLMNMKNILVWDLELLSMILYYVLRQFHKDILFIIEYWVFDKRYLGWGRSSDDGVGGIQAEYILPLHYDVTDQWYCISLTRDTLLRNATLPMMLHLFWRLGCRRAFWLDGRI